MEKRGGWRGKVKVWVRTNNKVLWPSQRPCGKVPLTGYRQALPRGREEKKTTRF